MACGLALAGCGEPSVAGRDAPAARSGAVASAGDDGSADPARRSAADPDPLASCIADLRARGEAAPTVQRALCSELTRNEIPGAAVAIADATSVRVALAAGSRCDAGDDPVLPDTAFRIGSISKALTAATAVRLHEGVALHDPVGPHLPAWPQALHGVTLRQLLDHTAGLPDPPLDASLARLEGEALVQALTRGAPTTPPGTTFHYANGGFVLAGLALTRATTTPWPRLLAEHVTGPAPVTADAVEAERVACGRLAGRAYTVQEDFDELAHGAAFTVPAGGLIVDAPRLASLAVALIDDLELDPEAPPAVASDRATWTYALGLRRRTSRDGTRVWFHGGDTGTFAADLTILPDLRIAVVTLARGDAHLSSTSLAALAHAAPQVDLAPPR